MAHATVGYLFNGNPENGGEGLLLGLNRCQAFKVAQRSYKGKGGTKVAKGDCLLTYCNVTGTDTGTPDKPKFALRHLWEYGLLPSLDALVAVGGLAEGAVVVHQEDNAGFVVPIPITICVSISLPTSYAYDCVTVAPWLLDIGPHKEGGYHAWLTDEFERRGWKLELQAPQGPYTNVLDLQVFPAMSKKHSELLQVYNNTEASVDRIWKVVQEIWNSMSSSMVARAFLLAYHIMAKIIETNGDTEWLSHGAPHCHVRRDYVDTERGVMKVSDVTTIDEDDPLASASY